MLLKHYRQILFISLLVGVSCSKGMKTNQSIEEIELKSTAASQEAELIRLNSENGSPSEFDQFSEQEEDTTSEGWYLKRSWGMDEGAIETGYESDNERGSEAVTEIALETVLETANDGTIVDTTEVSSDKAAEKTIDQVTINAGAPSLIEQNPVKTAGSNLRDTKQHSSEQAPPEPNTQVAAETDSTLTAESSFGVKAIHGSVIDTQSDKDSTEDTNSTPKISSPVVKQTAPAATTEPAKTNDTISFGVKLQNRFSAFAATALRASWAESRRGFCSRFVRQVIEKFVPSIIAKRAVLFGGSAIQTARLWRRANLVRSVAETQRTGGFKPGDVVFREYGSGGYGHVGIVFHNGKQLMIAENTTSSRSRDGRLVSSFTSFGAITGVGRFIEKYVSKP